MWRFAIVARKFRTQPLKSHLELRSKQEQSQFAFIVCCWRLLHVFFLTNGQYRHRVCVWQFCWLLNKYGEVPCYSEWTYSYKVCGCVDINIASAVPGSIWTKAKLCTLQHNAFTSTSHFWPLRLRLCPFGSCLRMYLRMYEEEKAVHADLYRIKTPFHVYGISTGNFRDLFPSALSLSHRSLHASNIISSFLQSLFMSSPPPPLYKTTHSLKVCVFFLFFLFSCSLSLSMFKLQFIIQFKFQPSQKFSLSSNCQVQILIRRSQKQEGERQVKGVVMSWNVYSTVHKKTWSVVFLGACWISIFERILRFLRKLVE